MEEGTNRLIIWGKGVEQRHGKNKKAREKFRSRKEPRRPQRFLYPSDSGTWSEACKHERGSRGEHTGGEGGPHLLHCLAPLFSILEETSAHFFMPYSSTSVRSCASSSSVHIVPSAYAWPRRGNSIHAVYGGESPRRGGCRILCRLCSFVGYFRGQKNLRAERSEEESLLTLSLAARRHFWRPRCVLDARTSNERE